MAKGEDSDKGLLDDAAAKLTGAAAKQVAKAAVDDLTRRAGDAVECVLGGAEDWMGKEAAEAEARRADSGLPPTAAQTPEWAASLEEEGDAAYQRGRALDDKPALDQEAEAARKAAVREQLARMKAALSAGRDPLLEEADRVLKSASAARRSTDEDLDAELEAMAAQVAAEAGAAEPDDEGAARTAHRPTLTPVPDTPLEALAEDALPTEEIAIAEPEIDPAMAALAAARAARAEAADEDAPVVTDEGGLDDVESILARARAARASAHSGHGAEEDEVRAAARARAARIADEALEAAQNPVAHLPDEPGLIAPPPSKTDPLASAEAVLARARGARIAAGTETDDLEAIRQKARDKVAKIIENPSGAALYRAREQVRQRSEEKDAAALAREVLERAGSRPSAADLAAQALDAGERVRAERERMAQEILSRGQPISHPTPTDDGTAPEDEPDEDDTPPKRRL